LVSYLRIWLDAEPRKCGPTKLQLRDLAARFELAQSRNDLGAATVVSLAHLANVNEVVATAGLQYYHYALLKPALRTYRRLAESRHN
jgi:hypothetical protein